VKVLFKLYLCVFEPASGASRNDSRNSREVISAKQPALDDNNSEVNITAQNAVLALISTLPQPSHTALPQEIVAV
jgi:hypothetical protein